ncbi:MAG TPA: hypothetical protein VL096_07800 [Pirellulaceae bacterium]|nr:hypothetical protein [Pirellulaceae bacterium]
MNAADHRHPAPSSKPTTAVRLGPTTYDNVASLIIALLILLGGAVFAMLIIVLTMRAINTPKSVPVSFVEEASGRGDHEAGSARDEKNSQVDEFDEFMPPPMDAAIQSVSDVISADLTVLESLDDQLVTSGTGQGKGDSRKAGPLGEGNDDIVPRWERWQVRFASADAESYARQLDFFGIELAAMGGGKPNVDYVAGVSQPIPRRRSGPSDAEKRLYMTWRTGELIEADKQLLAKAGVDTVGRLVLQFYSPETENVLGALEQKQLGMRTLKEIKRTVFGVKGTADKYEFYVISQEYRYAP